MAKHRGRGFATIEYPTGMNQNGDPSQAWIKLKPDGRVDVFAGTVDIGQGSKTVHTQIVADALGVTPDDVEVLHGDTSVATWGLDSYGSRSLAAGGTAIHYAAERVREKARKLAAHELEVAEDDLEWVDGKFQVAGSPDKAMTMVEIAGAAHIPPQELPTDIEPGLEETSFYDPENFVFPFGAHACIVDVDAETGKVDVVRYVAVDDCGPAINPKLIEGQIHGGIVHAIGQALFERIHYDEDGQLVTGTFVDYALPSAADVPNMETDRTETPSPVNSLGVKGVGEAGTIAASPAIVNAVIDALRPLGVNYIDMPLSPQNVWSQIQSAQGQAAPGDPGKQGGSWDEHGSGSAGSGPTSPSEGGAS